MIKTYVINLKDRKDRLENFNKLWRRLLDYEVFLAIGKDSLCYYDFNVFENWIDPILNRGLTKGEVGCFLSHYMLWHKCIDINEPIFILEDDTYPVDCTALKDNINKALETMRSTKTDLIYLGYTEMDSSSNYDDSFLIPGYPYLASSYIITPETCKKLIQTDIINSIIPVDEFLPLMAGCKIPSNFNDKGLKIMEKRLERFEKIDTLATRINQVEQNPREVDGTDVEPASEEDFISTNISSRSMHVFSFATDREKAKILEDSATSLGYTIYVLGTHDEWLGGDLINGAGGMQKLKTLYNYLKEQRDNIDEEDAILFTDGYDTFINEKPEEILKRFNEFNKDIVFSAEMECWPNRKLAEVWNSLDRPEQNNYLNSGGFVGKFSAVMDILEDTEKYSESYDDQLYLHRIFLKSKGVIVYDDIKKSSYDFTLDSQNYIFQCLSGGEFNNVEIAQNGQLLNTRTNSCPCILHGNGSSIEKQKFLEYANIINTQAFLPEQTTNISNNISIIHEWDKYFAFAEKHQHPPNQSDIVALQFLTEEGCDAIIEMSEKTGTWAPEPGDAYPGQEKRLASFWPEMFNAMNEYLHNHVFYHFERHWKPLVIPGIRDIFVIRYSIDTQKNLPLHHDSSLVSMSTKLNEDYRGGELVFPRQNFNNSYIPRGTAIAWPSQVSHPHESKDMIGGVKYSLTIWTARTPDEVNHGV